jgi:ATP-binding cassette, subfamily B, heavy metal transporter
MLHRLSLDFHVQRKSSELLRLVERTRSQTEDLVQWTVWLLAEQIFPIVLLCAASIRLFDWRYAAIMLASAAAFAGVHRYTQPRLDLVRREMHRNTDRSSQRAGDRPDTREACFWATG